MNLTFYHHILYIIYLENDIVKKTIYERKCTL